MSDESMQDKLHDLDQRLERIERVLGIFGWKPTPGFDPFRFQHALTQSFKPLWIGFSLALGVMFLVIFLVTPNLVEDGVSQSSVLGIPLIVEGHHGGNYPITAFGLPVGILAVHGLGLISVGGAGFGVIGIGGLGMGFIAVGGGAIGIISFGGGSLGVIAFGGGAVGYIAIGGGGYGKYVLASDGKGRYVFDRKRQDSEAVELFCRWFPRLRQAFTQEETVTA